MFMLVYCNIFMDTEKTFVCKENKQIRVFLFICLQEVRKWHFIILCIN